MAGKGRKNNIYPEKDKLVDMITNIGNNLWIPDVNTKIKSIENKTWFSIEESKIHNNNFKSHKITYVKNKGKDIKCKIIKLLLSPQQKK